MRINLFIVLLMLAFSAYPQHLIFRDYDVRDGLPSSTVYGMIQDSRGFMWFGTENGASRFDGRSFINFTRKDGLTDNTVLDIFEDSKGRIWFFTLNGRLCYYYNGKIFNSVTDDMLKGLTEIIIIARPFEDNEGNLYFTTTSEIYTFKDGKLIRENLRSSESDSFVLSVHFNKVVRATITNAQPFLFLKTDSFDFYSGHDIYRYMGKPVFLGRYEMLPHGIRTFNQKKFGNDLWIGTTEGAIKISGYDSGNARFQTYLEGYKVADVCLDKEGNYWFSTLGQGVKFLSSQNKYTLHYDRSATSPKETFQATVLWPYKGGVLAGTEKPMLVYLKDGKCTSFPLINGSPRKTDPVYDIYVDAEEKTLYVVTHQNFIRISDDLKMQEVITLSPENESAVDSLTGFNLYPGIGNYKAISRGPDENLLLTTRIGILRYEIFSLSNKNNFLVPVTKGNMIRNFTGFWSSDGTQWIGNAKGLSKVSGDTMITIKSKEPLLQEPISDIDELEDGNLVISTRTQGIYIFNGNDITETFDESKGLVSDICNKVRLDSNIIWVATAGGISKLQYNKGKLSLLANITASDGLPNNEVKDILYLNDTLYVATASGITLFPQTEPIVSSPPPFHLLSVEAGNLNLLSLQNPVLNYSENNLRFSFIGITFGEPNKVEYNYRLIGADDEWQTNNSGNIDYPSLRPGKYTFEVKARKKNSDWSESIVFPFEIKAPLWAQLWFRISGFLVLTLLTGSIFFTWYKKRRLTLERKLQLQHRLIQLEQQALNALMNPHFIFNSLNSIQQYLLQNNPQAVNKYLSLFAKLTRMNMEVLQKGEVTLDDEIERLEMYLKLEKLRFGNKLEYRIEIPDTIDMEEMILPPMILQPFVENAIWHGIMPQPHGGHINIKVYDPADGNFVIEISDNGIGLTQSEQIKNSRGIKHKSRGMELIRERLELWTSQYGKKFLLELKNHKCEVGEDHGTIVKLTLPVIMNYEYD